MVKLELTVYDAAGDLEPVTVLRAIELDGSEDGEARVVAFQRVLREMGVVFGSAAG